MHELRVLDVLRIGQSGVFVCVCPYNLWFLRIVTSNPWEPNIELGASDAPWMIQTNWIELNRIYFYNRVEINAAFDAGGYIGTWPSHLVITLLSGIQRADTIEDKRKVYLCERIRDENGSEAATC